MAAVEQRRVFSLWLAPLALYALVFFCFTAPLLGRFSTHFFADMGDGLVFVWNLWWVDSAVTRLRTQPWWTSYLHFPHGTSLLGHALNPFNGFVGILLQPWLGLVRTHNVIVVFGFVVGAYTAFRLALHVTGRTAGSLIAGFLFGFSSFHFAHAVGHLNLVSLEWIPLFLLAWLRLLERPSVGRGAQAALALFLVLLCDHYYFLYCVLAGALVLLVRAFQRRDLLFWLRPPFVVPLGCFVAVSALSSGALVLPLIWHAQGDPLSGAHPAGYFSMDLLSLWIPGGNWRFSELTLPFWSRLSGEPVHESSVHLGFAATLAIFFAWRQRASLRALDLVVWWVILVFFAVMSLGPFAAGLGRNGAGRAAVPSARDSPAAARALRLPGTHGRDGDARGRDPGRRGDRRAAAVAEGARVPGPLLLLLVMGIELLPARIPTTAANPLPGWVPALAAMPEAYGFMDVDEVVVGSPALYFQTVHEVPIFEGYIARIPASVKAQDAALRALRRRGNFRRSAKNTASPTSCSEPGAARAPCRSRRSGAERISSCYDVRSAWDCAVVPR